MLMIPLAVVRMPADRPAVSASLDCDLPRIQERLNHWCMIILVFPTFACDAGCNNNTINNNNTNNN